MNILGIETSCDETAAAVVKDGRQILSNIVASQIDLHARYGGVVPEVAARSHIEQMLPVVQAALDEAGQDWDGIDAIAVTAGPGLLGSLLVGTLTAKVLARLKNKPLLALNHVEAHVYANFIDPGSIKGRQPQEPWQPPEFPLLALIVSGGHSQLVLFRGHLDYEVLGQTRDDAVGEAFDKVAKILGLGYPGGPALAAAAENGNDRAFSFPKAKLGKGSLDFSFSGLKTAVLRTVQQELGEDHTAPSHSLAERLSERQISDFAASFEKTVTETLVDKAEQAFNEYRPASVVIAGGVAANRRLRTELASRLPVEMKYAPAHLCTDNAAMIASLGYHYFAAGRTTEPAELKTNSSLTM